jgi:hypothetical protein
VTSESTQTGKARWREFFLLEQRLSEARRDSFGASDPGWAEFVLARVALADANQLAQASDSADSALLLYRAAVVLLASAHRARPAQHVRTPEGQEPSLRLPADQTAVAELPSEQRTLVQEALEANPPELHLAKLSDAQRQLVLKGMQGAARTLADSLEARANQVKWIGRQRWLRTVLPAALALLLAAWAVKKIIEPTNLALHKSVKVSSNYARDRFPPDQVVDGDRSNIGFHTACTGGQWLIIDLEEVETIRGVGVFNRPDCCQERSVPLKLEASTDGEQFATLDRRTAQFDEWNVELPPTQARFVRLTNESPHCFHLAEVEVY